jgi:hypothetical protein
MKRTLLALAIVIAVPCVGHADNVLTLRCDGKVYFDSLTPFESEHKGVGATINFTKKTVEWVIEGLIYSTQITRMNDKVLYFQKGSRSDTAFGN